MAGAAVSAAIVAWLGLNTWRRQLVGQDRYQLAKELVLCLYQLRDQIEAARRPIVEIMRGEPRRLAEVQFMFGDLAIYEMARRAQRRLPEINETKKRLDSLALDAEVLWSDELKPHLEEISKLLDNFSLAVEYTVSAHNPEHDQMIHSMMSEMAADTGAIVLEVEKDNFNTSLSASISRIRAIVMPPVAPAVKR
ncbi:MULTISPECIES: hypothetical protein [unclassified Marinimicrobium]|uniref:hypothetical protein n=1 Tax=unclassified Marinimicrobium TaxID=2632100 RepID=UPI00257D1BD7|nr:MULTISPECIES: hypothetical protein [unclassified Marinimicrobium]